MQPEILGRLRQVAGSLAPGRLGFVEGGLAEPPAGPPAQTAGAVPPSCPAAVAREAEGIADAEVRARFLETAARYLARTEARERP
jgi:hypothetical protein